MSIQKAHGFVVFADADLANAAETIAITGFFNAGQDCTAATRVIVEESVYDEFVGLLAAQAKGLQTGAPSEEDVLFGPVNNANQLARVTGFLSDVPSHAKVVAGGKQVARDGFFIEPTVIADLKQGDRHIQEEIFGPAAVLQTFINDDDAVRKINKSRFGLGCSVWTLDASRFNNLSSRIDTGNVFLNSMVRSHVGLPYGGVKDSGYGRELGEEGLRELTNIKVVYTG